MRREPRQIGAHLFYVPDLTGPSTGGTLYNARLIAALRQLGQDASTCSAPLTEPVDRLRQAELLWVDSLYLEHVPALRQRLPASVQLGLLVHYLPTLLDAPEASQAEQFSEVERAALACVDRVVTPSPFMARVLRGLMSDGVPIHVIEPGCEVTLAGPVAEPSDRTRVLVVANLLPNKRVAPFLAELGRSVSKEAKIHVRVAGDTQLDPQYTALCLEHVDGLPALRGRVQLAGSVPSAELTRWYGEHDLLVSVSCFEAYGMALAEARTAGLPLLACAGGNIENFVRAEAGGQLCSSIPELVGALCALLDDPGQLTLRRRRAREVALPPRPWLVAASEFASGLTRAPQQVRGRE